MSKEDSTLAPGEDPVKVASLGNPRPKSGPSKHERCPHCDNVAVLEKSDTLKFTCGICGKARVPIDDPDVERRFDEKGALARATTARNASRVWAAVSAVSAAFSLLSLMFWGLAFAFASPPLVATVVALLAALTPMAFAVYGRAQIKRHEVDVIPALEEGWAAAARDLVEARGSVSADNLAKLMRVDGAWAERVHAALGAQTGVRAQIEDDGAGLSFQADREKVRVKASAKPSLDPSDDAPSEEETPEAKKERL